MEKNQTKTEELCDVIRLLKEKHPNKNLTEIIWVLNQWKFPGRDITKMNDDEIIAIGKAYAS